MHNKQNWQVITVYNRIPRIYNKKKTVTIKRRDFIVTFFFCRGFMSALMWRFVFGVFFSDVQKERVALIFKGWWVQDKELFLNHSLRISVLRNSVSVQLYWYLFVTCPVLGAFRKIVKSDSLLPHVLMTNEMHSSYNRFLFHSFFVCSTCFERI